VAVEPRHEPDVTPEAVAQTERRAEADARAVPALHESSWPHGIELDSWRVPSASRCCNARPSRKLRNTSRRSLAPREKRARRATRSDAVFGVDRVFGGDRAHSAEPLLLELEAYGRFRIPRK